MQKARDNLSAFQNPDTSGEGLSFFKRQKSTKKVTPSLFRRCFSVGIGRELEGGSKMKIVRHKNLENESEAVQKGVIPYLIRSFFVREALRA